MTGRAHRWLFALYVITAVLVTVQKGVLTKANNFRLFRAAAVNLLDGRDLYAAHPDQHVDYYKYSPTFALLFLPFAVLPFAVALLLWNLLNGLLLFYALRRLLPERHANLVLALVYLDVVFAMQYTQSNALVTALIVLAFVELERGRQLRAALLIGLDAFIKIFPLAAVVPAIFHPRRRRFALLFTAVVATLAVLPLVAVPAHELVAQYRSWGAMEAADAAQVHRGDSVMQYLYLWFGADWPGWPIQLAGTLVLLAPVAVRRDRWTDPQFRLQFLCSLLVFVVLFNHQSERASFVIAYTGLFVWYVSGPPDRLRLTLLALALGMLVVNDTEVLPTHLRAGLLARYRFKGLPCLLAWVVMQAELLGWRTPGAATRPRQSGPTGSPPAGTARGPVTR